MNCEDKIDFSFKDAFNIPNNLKHDHSSTNLENMREGIKKLIELLALTGSDHDKCIEEVIVYAELNIRYMFIVNLLPDKTLLKDAYEMFAKNMDSMFKKEQR